MEQSSTSKVTTIKNIYLYLVSFVALMMIVFPAADLISTLLRSYVFTHADQDYYQTYPCAVPMMAPASPGIATQPPTGGKTIDSIYDCTKQQEAMKQQAEQSRQAQRERDLIRDISFIVVGILLFFFHWRIVKRRGEW